MPVQTTFPEPNPSPWLAFALTLILPGTGHFLVGRPLQGLLLHLGWLGVLALGGYGTAGTFRGLALTAGVGLAGVLAAAGHAAALASQPGCGVRAWQGPRYVLLPLALILAFIMEPRLLRSLAPAPRFRLVRLDTGAMAPTLAQGDRIVADRHWYRHHPLRRQDLILCEAPAGGKGPSVLRCVALPGDRVELRDGQVLVNGVARGEAGRCAGDPALHPPVLPEGTLFCLGDNGPGSLDSRAWGPLPVRAVEGRPLYFHLPLDRARLGRAIR